jgi:hypothetical protein
MDRDPIRVNPFTRTLLPIGTRIVVLPKTDTTIMHESGPDGIIASILVLPRMEKNVSRVQPCGKTCCLPPINAKSTTSPHPSIQRPRQNIQCWSTTKRSISSHLPGYLALLRFLWIIPPSRKGTFKWTAQRIRRASPLASYSRPGCNAYLIFHIQSARGYSVVRVCQSGSQRCWVLPSQSCNGGVKFSVLAVVDPSPLELPLLSAWPL